ncbi:hypothetical protein ACIP1T_13490 [Pseudomonas japonica]|uniref:hypothetical protein n=1 Tax=Pseudomonas TaxID=286 RepID=UPI002929978E|nr:hypothetical protein [Pseudomonas sp. zfem002]MDU9389815.1 hypothetical protein [Pseudomonas sp. zfem002]
MKKLVPDPPPTLSVRPGLTHDEAIRTADEHFKSALNSLTRLPLQLLPRNQDLLDAAVIDLRIGKALLSIALAPSTTSIPID